MSFETFPESRVHVGDGPLAVEAALLESLASACAGALTERDGLARPLRVLVPSHSLRLHLAGALLEQLGRPALGVQIQTLDAAARELLERAGEAPADATLFGVAVRERARREPALAEALDPLDDGHAAVAAAVDDLLDAGYRPEHEAPLRELLAERVAGRARARAAALLRVASDVGRELAAGTLGHRSAVLARSAERLDEDGPQALPTRALWIHGFADATGVQLDWLEALLRHFDASVWLDAPGGLPRRFGRRLRERLAPGADADESAPAAVGRCSKSLHSDLESEARAAAEWARGQIDAGAPPERLALIVRDLASHALALRRQLDRLCVPHSGEGGRGGAGPVARRLDAALALLERGAALPAERWLDARAGLTLAERADLRDALHGLGAASLGDAARLPDERLGEALKLGASTSFAVTESGGLRSAARRVSAGRLRALRDLARATLASAEREPAPPTLAARLAALAELGGLLAWQREGPERSALEAAFPDPPRAGARPISRADWTRLLRRALDGAGYEPLGGDGGGVQVLGVMEARGRSFAALRVLGLVRGAFPRSVGEDPLLPDALRRPLRDLLPDLPVKRDGRDEERFLFAQLLRAAPEVQLSRARRDAQGRPSQASPLFESVDAPVEEGAPHAPEVLDAPAPLAAALATARDAAGLAPLDCGPAARGRLAALRELDGRRRGLGPYLGVVGPARAAGDPRGGTTAITLLEAVARCPWQAFLERLLRLGPAPDAHGPLPPARDPRLLGNAVHAALQDLCDPRNGSPWPDAAPEAWLVSAAARVARGAGIALPGFERALARRAAPFVEAARALDLADPWGIAGVETWTEVEVADAAGAPRRIGFRADRSEERDGALRLSDWKTGAAKVKARGAGARADALAKLVASGELLQAHAYAASGARGRYVYLHPEIDPGQRVVEAEPGGAQLEAFAGALAALGGALDAGALPPRLVARDTETEPRACAGCEVKQACVRGDSGARARVVDWAERGEADGGLEAAALAAWCLGGSAP